MQSLRNELVAPRVSLRRSSAALLWLLLSACLLALPGCSGCSQDPLDGEAETADKIEKDLLKKKEKPKPDFEPIKLTVIPQKSGEGESKIRLIKPGHWTAAVEETKANNFDFNGQLFAEVREEGLGKAVDLERMPHKLAILRPAALGKGTPKHFELMFFVPRDRKKAWLASELRSKGGGIAATPGPEPLSPMKAYQYNLIVLGSESDRYRPLEKLDSVRAPHINKSGRNGNFDLGGPLKYYDVIPIPPIKPLPLPSNSLAWTTVAYVVWDDLDPNTLSLEQQQALVDWLHWGGQLIISGPKSLDQLRDKSFLGNYLPALPGEPQKISTETLAPLSSYWTPMEKGKPGRPLAPVNEWSGITLIPQTDSKFLPHTNDLVVERRVGRGRIVATAFRLTERALWNWPGFDGFVNACLLRRPPRQFSQPFASDDGPMQVSVDWAHSTQQFDDPALVSQLRYLTRDWDEKNGFTSEQKFQQRAVDDNTMAGRMNQYAVQGPDGQLLDDNSRIGPGYAAWNDFSSTANAARTSLREAAGIVIPPARFVVWVLVCYLAVLVPLNWLLFRILGRVEWAWVAAPLIAIGGMAVVVKVAQLDIGFARSQTELAVLELQNGYPRGHLTRYTALYTSLSTTYDVNTEERTALLLPFALDPDFVPLPGQSSDTVSFHTDPKIQLSDFDVSSNSTAMLHGEQMFDLGGAIQYNDGTDELANRSKQKLALAALLRRTPENTTEWCWVGDLAAGASTKLNWQPLDTGKDAKFRDWSFELAVSNNPQGPKLSLNHVADLVRNEKLLKPGETRMLALIAEPLPGLNVEPAASQTGRGATLVVANLTPPTLAEAARDTNSRRSVLADELTDPEADPTEVPESQ